MDKSPAAPSYTAMLCSNQPHSILDWYALVFHESMHAQCYGLPLPDMKMVDFDLDITSVICGSTELIAGGIIAHMYLYPKGRLADFVIEQQAKLQYRREKAQKDERDKDVDRLESGDEEKDRLKS
ncbi:hypothetical protein F5884DRAFT_860575 [Xylogone sp. PMI_703]|nr:hypothetical protein F5884DRAFT_860575 [Xylogone sp. PMI_703]